MEKRTGVVEGYSPVAGEWYPAIEYPYPKVYHEFVRDDLFEEMYPELVDAGSVEDIMNLIENAKDGDEVLIKLTEDLVDIETIIIPAGKKVKLNLNGHRISAAKTGYTEFEHDKHYYAIDNYGDIIICGKGLIEGRGIDNYGFMCIKDGVEVVDLDIGGSCIWNGYEGEGVGTLIVDGGIFRVTQEGTSSYGACGIQNYFGTVVVNGGKFYSVDKRNYNIWTMDEDGSLTINNAYVEGVHGAVAVDAGGAVINRGTFKSSEYYALYVSNDAHWAAGGGPSDADVLVKNGNFTGKTYSVLVGSDVHKPVNSVIKIEGGTYNNPLMIQNNVSEGAGIIYPEDMFDLEKRPDGSKILIPKATDTVEESEE